MSEATRRPTPYRIPRDRPHWRTIIGWVLVAIGVILFLAGNMTSRAGIAIPIDSHHVISQLVGAALAMLGLRWAVSKR